MLSTRSKSLALGCAKLPYRAGDGAPRVASKEGDGHRTTLPTATFDLQAHGHRYVDACHESSTILRQTGAIYWRISYTPLNAATCSFHTRSYRAGSCTAFRIMR